MSALDRLVSHLRVAAGSQGEWLYVPYSVRVASAEHKEAEAELAMLRRCREAVVEVRAWAAGWVARDGLADTFDEMTRVRFQDRVEAAREILAMLNTHAADCPALAIDALAKEVRGE